MRERRHSIAAPRSDVKGSRPLSLLLSGGLGDIIKDAYWSPFFRRIPALIKRGYSIALEVCCPYQGVRELFAQDPRYRYMQFPAWGTRPMWKRAFISKGDVLLNRTNDESGDWMIENNPDLKDLPETPFRLPLEPEPRLLDYRHSGWPFCVCQPVGGKISGYGKRITSDQILVIARMLAKAGIVLVVLHDQEIPDLPDDDAILDLTGQTSIAESCWIVRESAGFVGVDSFLKYIAFISEIPAVVFWGANQHMRNYYLGEWKKSPRLRVVLSPNDHVAAVSRDDIETSVHWMLEGNHE